MSNEAIEKKKTIKNAIFCTTPFHVLGAIAISRDQASETDIYITNQFGDSQRLARELKKEGRFHDVIYIDAQKQRIEVPAAVGLKKIGTNAHSLLQYIGNCAGIRKTVRRYLHLDYDYERIFIASNSMAGRYAILYYVKMKKSFQLWQYDDGLGSYENDIAERIPLYDRFFRVVFFGKKAICIKKRRIFFSPEYYKRLHGNERKVSRIPDFSDTDRELIFRLYRVENDYGLLPGTILIDTVNEGYSSDGWKRYLALRDRIGNYIGKENIVYKKHPRDITADEDEKRFAAVPFEILCMKKDLSDSILITCVSSAVYTAKLMFDQEPVVILLCKILEDGMPGYDKAYKHIEIFRDLYKDRSKILMPESEEELFLALEDLPGS